MTSKTKELVEKEYEFHRYRFSRIAFNEEIIRALMAIHLDAVDKEVAEKDAEIVRLEAESDDHDEEVGKLKYRIDRLVCGDYQYEVDALRAQVKTMRRVVDTAVVKREKNNKWIWTLAHTGRDDAVGALASREASRDFDAALTSHIEATKEGG